jgi:hypothetical protein
MKIIKWEGEYFTEECLYSYDKFGETVIQNLCTYEEVHVPWSIFGWLSFVVVVIAWLIIFYKLIEMIFERDDKDE